MTVPGDGVQLTVTLELLLAGTATLVGGSSVATDAVVLPVPDASQKAEAGGGLRGSWRRWTWDPPDVCLREQLGGLSHHRAKTLTVCVRNVSPCPLQLAEKKGGLSRSCSRPGWYHG